MQRSGNQKTKRSVIERHSAPQKVVFFPFVCQLFCFGRFLRGAPCSIMILDFSRSFSRVSRGPPGDVRHGLPLHAAHDEAGLFVLRGAPRTTLKPNPDQVITTYVCVRLRHRSVQLLVYTSSVDNRHKFIMIGS